MFLLCVVPACTWCAAMSSEQCLYLKQIALDRKLIPRISLPPIKYPKPYYPVSKWVNKLKTPLIGKKKCSQQIFQKSVQCCLFTGRKNDIKSASVFHVILITIAVARTISGDKGPARMTGKSLPHCQKFKPLQPLCMPMWKFLKT